MTEKNLFEEATKRGLRFETAKGHITTEDVWNLPLTTRGAGVSLDALAKQLNRQIRESEEESFVSKRSRAGELVQLKFEIVKHIIDVRLAEKEAEQNAAKRSAERQKIMGILEEKEEESLRNLSPEELRKRLENA